MNAFILPVMLAGMRACTNADDRLTGTLYRLELR